LRLPATFNIISTFSKLFALSHRPRETQTRQWTFYAWGKRETPFAGPTRRRRGKDGETSPTHSLTRIGQLSMSVTPDFVNWELTLCNTVEMTERTFPAGASPLNKGWLHFTGKDRWPTVAAAVFSCEFTTRRQSDSTVGHYRVVVSYTVGEEISLESLSILVCRTRNTSIAAILFRFVTTQNILPSSTILISGLGRDFIWSASQ